MSEGLIYYHWGQPTSTTPKYGFDIRCEVLLLTRNVRIVGSEGNQGATLTTASIIEMNDIDFTLTARNGQTIIDNVELENMSQIDSENAGLRFEQATEKWHSITNCAFHHGLGWGAKVRDSENVYLHGNIIYSFVRIGITFDGVKNITFDNNFVGKLPERVPDEPRGGVLGCSFLGQKCTDLHITNNIVAGSGWTGYTTRGHSCGAQGTQQVFRNNTAHSIQGFGGGYCIEIEVDKYEESQLTCYAASHFNTYKCTHHGLATYQDSRKVVITNANSMDHFEGFTAMLATGHDEYHDFVVEISDSNFYGETEILDCPSSSTG